MSNADALKQYNIQLAVRAAYEGDVDVLKQLIEIRGVDVNAISDHYCPTTS